MPMFTCIYACVVLHRCTKLLPKSWHSHIFARAHSNPVQMPGVHRFQHKQYKLLHCAWICEHQLLLTALFLLTECNCLMAGRLMSFGLQTWQIFLMSSRGREAMSGDSWRKSSISWLSCSPSDWTQGYLYQSLSEPQRNCLISCSHGKHPSFHAANFWFEFISPWIPVAVSHCSSSDEQTLPSDLHLGKRTDWLTGHSVVPLLNQVQLLQLLTLKVFQAAGNLVLMTSLQVLHLFLFSLRLVWRPPKSLSQS